MEAYSLISSVSCFHVFPCVHFQCPLPAPARACVLRDLTNEHKVTKFEQEEEHDNEVGCQDEMPRILFPLPAPARARARAATGQGGGGGGNATTESCHSLKRSWHLILASYVVVVFFFLFEFRDIMLVR